MEMEKTQQGTKKFTKEEKLSIMFDKSEFKLASTAE